MKDNITKLFFFFFFFEHGTMKMQIRKQFANNFKKKYQHHMGKLSVL